MFIKIAGGIAGILVLLLASYGAWALAFDGPRSSGASAASSDHGGNREEALPAAASPTPGQGDGGSQGWQQEMTSLCTKHMAEMQPVMEEMMQDMMGQMMRGDGMKGMMGGGGMNGEMMGR